MMGNQFKAYILVGLTVLLWSTVASAFKITLREVDFLQLLFYASMTSFIILTIILFLSGRIRELINQESCDLLRSAGMGLINPLVYYILLFKAYSLLPAQEAQPLNWTWPIVLTLLSALILKQRISIRGIFAILMCFLGVVIIAVRGNFTGLKFENLWGVSFALSSSLFWAIFWIFNLKDERQPLIKLTLCFFFGTIYSAMVVGLFSKFQIAGLVALLGMVYIGLFEMGITFILWLKALSLARSSASIATFAYITPFLSLVFIRIVVGERILWSSIVGLLLIISGIIFQEWRMSNLKSVIQNKARTNFQQPNIISH